MPGTRCGAAGTGGARRRDPAAAGRPRIAEVELLRDPRDGVFTLLDLNTRPWKWIGLPIAVGVDLPWLFYAAATGTATDPVEWRADVVWVSLKDYLSLRARGGDAGGGPDRARATRVVTA